MTLQKGDIVDRYRLEEPLGIGAFGEVWKASKLANGVSVGVTCAVKVMRLADDRSASSPRALANGWLDEVRNLVRVTDETIPRIHEANVWNEHAYIAMELLDGSTLAARLAHGPIPWRRALFIADQIARALETAHQIGIVHRDLKPQNVMLAGPKRVCVVDWGIARFHTSIQADVSGIARRPTVALETTDPAPVRPIVTARVQRVAVGTPGYMAPEVYDGTRAAPEQDVYALGVVLYEMIAGCLPHAVDPINRSVTSVDAMKSYRMSLDKATMDYSLVPLRERCPEIPSGVIKLVDSLLDRDPDRRPRRLREAIEYASRFPHGVPDPPYPGLSILGPQHAALYFGQQDAIHHVLDRLRSQRGALLWGPSGSGKSSLALAGVAATMDRTLFLDLDGWSIHVIRPCEGQGFQVMRDAVPSRHPGIGHVVVVDQLEEVVDLERSARSAFCAAVLALLERSAPVLVRDTVIEITDEVKLIATIRDDLEWRVDREVPALRPLLERRIIVKGVDANFAQSIIREPARALGYDIEAIDVVSREVAERLSSDPAKLPVIQYALSEWWERRNDQDRVLPVSAWHELGGVDGALSFVAERFFSELDHGEALRVKELFVRLFHRGRKQPLAESELSPRERVMIEKLTRLRLVGRREKKGIGPFYEVEHEYLAENWTRLASWLAEARDDRMLAEELERDAAAYLRDPDSERLWRKGRLASAVDLAESGRVVLNTSAKLFLQQAGRKELRGRLVSRAAIVAGVAVILGVVYALVLNNAVKVENARARARAEEMQKDAAQKEARATEKLEHADKELRNANDIQRRADAEVAVGRDRVRRAQVEAKREKDRIVEKEREVDERSAKAGRRVVLAEQKVRAAEQFTKVAEEQADTAAQHAKVANAQADMADQHAKTAERRANTAEQHVKMAEAQRKAAEQRAIAAEAHAIEAEQRAMRAEAHACSGQGFIPTPR